MKPSPELNKTIDPYGGFLHWASVWRPNPDAPDPDMPGLKQTMIMFLPLEPEADCLCGSNRPYQACCRPKSEWQPICYNPDLEGYSLVVVHHASFQVKNAATLRRRLDDDLRLACTEDTAKRAFWILWGNPAFETDLGIMCFGDIELKNNRRLVVTAMSGRRMENLLDLLQEIAADCLGEPKITRDPPQTVRKSLVKHSRRQKRRWRK